MTRLPFFVVLSPMLFLGAAQDRLVPTNGEKESPSCCAATATARFAMLAADESFRAAHHEPIPFTLIPEIGKSVTFKTADGGEGRAYEVKAAIPTTRTILMIHEWWGLNDYIRREAEKLQRELGTVNVLALDLFDGKVASTREEASKNVREAKEERIREIIKGAFAYLGPDSRVGTIGWCFGGGWSLQAALLGAEQVKACVIYYGMPETAPEKLRPLAAPLLGIFAERDRGIPPSKVKEFEEAMKTAKKSLTVKMYDAEHAFANPSNPRHDKEATEDALKLTLAFFKKHLLQ